jgi:hypothetical protein
VYLRQFSFGKSKRTCLIPADRGTSPCSDRLNSWLSARPAILTTAFTCPAGCKERDVSKSRNAGPVKCNAWLSRDPAVFVQPCRLTMKLIQIGAKGDVQPFETG